MPKTVRMGKAEVITEVPSAQVLANLRQAAAYESQRLATKAKSGQPLSTGEVLGIEKLAKAVETVDSEERKLRKDDYFASLTPAQKLEALREIETALLSELTPDQRREYLESLQRRLLT